MHLPFFIAKRYLFSKAHRNVINIISIVSAVAIGIGCMALVVILSVYNGFDRIVASSLESYVPDYVIQPVKGKTINLKSRSVESALEQLKDLESGNLASNSEDFIKIYPVLEETVYVQYGVVQSVARIKGVPETYQEQKRLSANIVDGVFSVSFGQVPRAVVEEDLAMSLMLRPQFTTPLEIYLPSRTDDISLVMPSESLMSQEIRPAGIIALSSQNHKGTIYVPDYIARSLMELDSAYCSSVEIFIGNSPHKQAGAEKDAVRKARHILGEEFMLKDRYQQNETVFKMMKAEKFAIYMILIFVVAIISVNLLSSLSMLIIEKKEDIRTYGAMGMWNSTIRKSFLLQGWLICMAGAVVGVVFGLVLCWLQHTFGLVPLPGNFVVSSYPVAVRFQDVLLTLGAVAVIGLVMAYIPTRSIDALRQ